MASREACHFRCPRRVPYRVVGLRQVTVFGKFSWTCIHTWCLTNIQDTAPPITGQIKEILQDINAENSKLVLLDIFQVNEMRHEFFGMPILSRRLDEVSLVLIQSKVLSHIMLWSSKLNRPSGCLIFL